MTSESESEPEYCKYAYRNDFDSSSAPTGNGHQETGVQVQNLCYPRSVQSVIQTDLDHPDCQHYREQLLSTFKDSLIMPRGYDEDANEHRGPNAIVRLDFVQNPKRMSCKAIRPVGPREAALRDKIGSFEKRVLFKNRSWTVQNGWVGHFWSIYPMENGGWSSILGI